MKPYTNQTAFNKVCKHLTRPRAKQSYSRKTDTCLYRTPSGNSCAIGCLIPDNKYQKNFEGNSIRDLLAYSSSSDLIFLRKVNCSLLVRLQAIHDARLNWKDKKYLIEELKIVAMNFNLKLPTCLK